jgi:hypothetical protein
MKSESIKELATALAKVKFGEIGKSKTVKVQTKSGASYNFEYAPLEVIMGAIRGPLAEQGLSLSQSVLSLGPNCWTVVTNLLHSSGEWMSCQSPVVAKEGCTAQEMGSAITYARRYGVTLACCLVADEDDDGNIADGNSVQTVKKPFAEAHKPTDGAWENLSPDERTFLSDIAMTVVGLLADGKVKEACAHLDDQLLDADEKVAIWTRFDSKQRSAMKKYRESTKEPAHAV